MDPRLQASEKITPFHPVVDAWFRERFLTPTDPQTAGWREIAAGRHTLIAAPTGSGKTLAAFLISIDRLLRLSLEGTLKDQTYVLYVSPLKALSNDIHRNLQGPLEEIAAKAVAEGRQGKPLRALIRTGDTPAHVRASMLKKPPHILVTTPESLYLLLTSPRSRRMLAGVETVIVDEIHAVARDKRGSHLALSLERLEALTEKPALRIGLSATQKPIDEIARFLVGTKRVAPSGKPECAIVDTGHARRLDLSIEVPASDLSAVCTNEQWDGVYKRLGELISSHRSTLIFVNTRRMAERVSHRLRAHLGEDAVASHHGSLSREIRLSVEERLKNGELKAIVATASLELGIDIGFIDLVCQLGSSRSIATLLQRVGRSGHHLGALPKGKIFALTRDELLESLALIRAVRGGRLDRVEIPERPLDVLAQQIVAEVSGGEWKEDELFERFRGAWPYRDLSRKDFDRILSLLSEGVAPGRKDGAYLHWDKLNHVLRARRSAPLAAITSGGAIPETADYRVVTEDDNTFVGTVNEDFAIETLSGDVFLLGNTSWRVRYVRAGQVVVRDAEGAPATIPFWLGEAPGRTVELSRELSQLREDIAAASEGGREAAMAGLKAECGADQGAAGQAADYVMAQKAAVGFVPTQSRILFERFFDDSGGMQLVIHSPYGIRINRAWGLALRKRFCRTFDFELQASADDNGITLSLGPQHSFPLEQMFKMIRSENAREILIQALLAAPMFQVRWRWNLTRSLAVLRNRAGKKVPPPLQRFKADDLLTAVFPAQTACLENRPGDIVVPDHPLVNQTVFDCLHEAMDAERWENLLKDIEAGNVSLIGKDTREPSPFSHSILNANPYAFLDDAPLEERRARAVAVRRTLSLEDMRDLARLDPEAIERVRAEAWPVVRDAEELHDALLSAGAIPASQGESWKASFDELAAQGRACEARRPQGPALWVAAERWPLVHAALPDSEARPAVSLPPELQTSHERSDAVLALVRGRLEIAGPVSEEKIAADLGLDRTFVNGALQSLETEGFAIQGKFTPAAQESGSPVEWCERRLLARIHRLTLEGARKRVQPVPPETFWRFLSEFHHFLPGSHREGALGLYEALSQLQGFEMPAGAWEADALSGRVDAYQPDWLDALTHSGELAWGRMRVPKKLEDPEPTGAGLTRVVPVSMAFREDLSWMLPPERLGEGAGGLRARPEAQTVYDALKDHGALFFHELLQITGFSQARLEDALSELAALGAVTADGFEAVRSLISGHSPWQRRRLQGPRPRSAYGRAGRWALFPGKIFQAKKEERNEQWARQLLRRYGVMFRDLLAREASAPSWWELAPVYRKMEAQGKIYGGRFVSGVAGEQYALPEAVEALRRTREGEDDWMIVSGVDPLNLSGITGSSGRVPAMTSNRLLVHNGTCVAVLKGGEVQLMRSFSEEMQNKMERALRLTQVPQLREELLKELSGSRPISSSP